MLLVLLLTSISV